MSREAIVPCVRFMQHGPIQREHRKETLSLLLAEGIRPALEIRSSTYVYKDPDIPRLLSKFPVVSVLVGVESFKEEDLKYYRKGREKEDSPRFVRVMKDHGLKVVGAFIWGNKFDTPDSLHRLLDRIFELRLSHFQVGMLCPFPGTDLYKEVSDVIFVKDWSYYDIMHVTHFHPKMDPYTMQSTWIKAQKDIWSLSSMIKRRTEFFSPPINKLFYWLVTRFAEAEFREFLDFLSTIDYRKAMEALPAEAGVRFPAKQ